MSDIAKAYVQIIPSAEGIQGSLTKLFAGESQSAGKSIGAGMGGSIMKTLAAVGVAKAVKDSVVAVFKTGGEFDTAMSQVAATMGKSVDDISELRDVAKEMGATTAFTATEAAEGLNYLALAGYTVEQQMAALPTVLNLAAAGAMDLGSASDMVTDAMSALGIEVTQENLEGFADQLAKTASKSNTSVAQLGDALLTVGGTAKILSGGTVEAATALGILADNGIKASEGGTHLRNILLALNPTTDKAVAAWDQLGVSAYDTDGKLRPIEKTFADLDEAMSDFTDQEKQDILTKMFNKTDLAAVNALLSTSSDRWEELGEAIENSGGAASEMAATQLDNFEGKLTLMGSALDGLKLSLWDTFSQEAGNAVEAFTGIITDVQGFVDEHSGEISSVISGVGDLLTGDFKGAWEEIGPVATGAWESIKSALEESPLGNLFSDAQLALDALAGAFPGFSGAASAAISSVIGAVNGLIGAIQSAAHAIGGLSMEKLGYDQGGNLINTAPDGFAPVGMYAKAYDNPYLLNTETVFGRSGNKLLLGGDRGGYRGGELVYSHDNLMDDIAAASGADRLDELIILFGEFMEKYSKMGMYMNGQLVGAIGPGMRSYDKRADQMGGW